MFYSTLFVLFSVTAYSSAGPRCPSRDGQYPVYIPASDCSKFYECSNGTPYLFECPAGLHFNPAINVCDWPYRAGCREHQNEEQQQ